MHRSSAETIFKTRLANILRAGSISVFKGATGIHLIKNNCKLLQLEIYLEGVQSQG